MDKKFCYVFGGLCDSITPVGCKTCATNKVCTGIIHLHKYTIEKSDLESLKI
jgi:hypothetical protein